MAYREPARELGPLEREFASKPPARTLLLFAAIFGLPGLALISGIQSAPGQIFAGDRLTNCAIGAVLGCVFVWFARMVLRKSKLRISVHARGMVWHERGLRRHIYWDMLATVEERRQHNTAAGITAARVHTYRILLNDGTTLCATHMLAGVQELGARLQRELASRS